MPRRADIPVRKFMWRGSRKNHAAFTLTLTVLEAACFIEYVKLGRFADILYRVTISIQRPISPGRIAWGSGHLSKYPASLNSSG